MATWLSVKPAPTYRPGSEVQYRQLDHAVIDDLGEFVKLSVPASMFSLRGGHALTRPSGNTATISKADLVLENLK